MTRAELKGVLWLLLAFASLTNASPQTDRYTVILGDSIARGWCCSVFGPEHYLPDAFNLAIDGNTIGPVTGMIAGLPPGRVYIHVGVNDIMRDNPKAQIHLDRLLQAIRKRSDVFFVVDQIGPLRPDYSTDEREAMRFRMNMQLRLARAPNLRVLPFVATSFIDGCHPNDRGYAQQMPAVLAAFGRQ